MAGRGSDRSPRNGFWGRLERKFEGIGAGTVAGHNRSDIPYRTQVRFEIEKPFVIAFDPISQRIVRVMHGARDMSAIFGEG